MEDTKEHMLNIGVDEQAVYVHRIELKGEATERDFYRASYELLRTLCPDPGDKVLIKPNVTIPTEPDSGIITHPAFVGGIVDYLLEIGVEPGHIAVGEGIGTHVDMTVHFVHGGYEDLATEKGIQLANLNQDTPMRVHISPDGKPPKELSISRMVRGEGRYVINVPKMKTHRLTQTTLCMKNLMGTITPMHLRHLCQQSFPPDLRSSWSNLTEEDLARWEERMGEKLSELSCAVQPDLHIVEGVVGREGTGFRRGRNRPTGLSVAGVNGTAVDAVVTVLMGFDPQQVGYLKKAVEWGLGPTRLDNIPVFEVQEGEVVPCDIHKLVFDPPFKLIRFG